MSPSAIPVAPSAGKPELAAARPDAFRAVAAMFAVAMAGTTIPTPLYGLYQRAYELSPLAITVLFAVYAFGVLAALISFGRLSDDIGRRPVLLAACALAAASATTFLVADSLWALCIARVLSGVSAGLVAGTATAALLDLGGPDRRGRSAVLGVAANMGGLAAGTFVAGVLADLAPNPLQTPFWTHLALVVLATVAIVWLVPGAGPQRHWRIRPQRPGVPKEVRALFFRAVLAGGSGFAVTGLLTSVSAVFLAKSLGYGSHTLAGGVVALAFATTAAGQLGARRIAVERALPLACAGLIVACALVGTALASTTLAPLLLGAVVLGVATGVAVGGGLAGIAAATPPARRGETSSAFFAGLYAMLAVPVLAVGIVSRYTSIQTAGLALSVATALLCLGVLISLIPRRP